MIQKLIHELHQNGLSDVALHLQIWYSYATPQQERALQTAVLTVTQKGSLHRVS